MSVTMDEGIKRWTAKRKTALVAEIIQGKPTVAEASRAYDLSPSDIEGWVDDAKRGMENAPAGDESLAQTQARVVQETAILPDGM